VKSVKVSSLFCEKFYLNPSNFCIAPYQAAIRNLGGIPVIIPLLGHVNQIIQMLAAWALSNLALDGMYLHNIDSAY
jgi:hypothetical protein